MVNPQRPSSLRIRRNAEARKGSNAALPLQQNGFKAIVCVVCNHQMAHAGFLSKGLKEGKTLASGLMLKPSTSIASLG
jgi:hypothetical protein